MPKIVRFHELGGPEVLRFEEIPSQQPGQGEVKLRVQASGLNRAESAYYHGKYFEQPQFPSRVGYEVAGVVEWPVALRGDLRRALISEGLRKVDQWAARYSLGIAEWPATPVDPFFNVNTPAEAAEADRMAALHPDI